MKTEFSLQEINRLSNDPHDLVAELVMLLATNNIDLPPNLAFGATEFLRSDPLGRNKPPGGT